MGGAFKRGGKDDDKGQKDDSQKGKKDERKGDKKDDRKGGLPPHLPQKSPKRHEATAQGPRSPPKLEVTSPDAARAQPAVITEPGKVSSVGISRMASITDQVIKRKKQKQILNPAFPSETRRASLPVLMAEPFLSPHDTRGAYERDPSLKMRRKSTAVPYRRRTSTVIEEEQYVKDPLECLLPVYEHEDRMNIPPASCSLRSAMYVECTCIGVLFGIVMALITKGILLIVYKII